MFEKDLRGYCYSDLGHYTLICNFSGDSFSVGDKVGVNIGIDASKLKTNVKSTKCILNQIITLQAQDFTKNLIFPITTMSLQGVNQGEKKIKENSIPVIIGVDTRSDQQASSNGVLVRNEFKLRIQTNLEACFCCQEHPYNEVDIKIFNKKIDYNIPDFVPDFAP